MTRARPNARGAQLVVLRCGYAMFTNMGAQDLAVRKAMACVGLPPPATGAARKNAAATALLQKAAQVASAPLLLVVLGCDQAFVALARSAGLNPRYVAHQPLGLGRGGRGEETSVLVPSIDN